MEGAALAAKARQNLAFWQAWHVEAFARMKGPEFKKALRDFMADDGPGKRSPSDAIAFFHRLKASGVPVEIERVVH